MYLRIGDNVSKTHLYTKPLWEVCMDACKKYIQETVEFCNKEYNFQKIAEVDGIYLKTSK